MSANLGCDYEAPTFGAHYPDGTCIDGHMWDLDSGDSVNGLTSGGDVPCPWCNTRKCLDYWGYWFSGNSHQRRIARRQAMRRVRKWAEDRSSFPPAKRVAIAKANQE